MAANLMDLVRELKSLNARKKAGEELGATDEARRKELKAYLRTALEQQGGASGSSENSAVSEAPTTRAPSPRAVSIPDPAPMAAPRPEARPAVAPAAVPAPMPQRPSPAPLPGMGAPAAFDDPSDAHRQGRLDNPPSQPVPKPYVPKKDAFAIDLGKAGSLIDDAMKSDAVSKVDPWSNRQAHASQAELDDSAAAADAALRANKKRPRAQTPDEVVAQLKEAEASYTPPEEAHTLEQYYGDYAMDGFTMVDAQQAQGLKPIDPREIELQRAGVEAVGAVGGSVVVPRGLAFLDDFPVLYSKRMLPPPDDEVAADSNDPSLLVPGRRKVTVHLLNGEKRQGSIRALKRGDLGFKLEPVGSGMPEEMSFSQCRVVFIHVANNAPPREMPGRPLTVTFRDGRSAQGTSDDYQPGAQVFSIVPPAGRGQFERVIINGSFVQAVN